MSYKMIKFFHIVIVRNLLSLYEHILHPHKCHGPFIHLPMVGCCPAADGRRVK